MLSVSTLCNCERQSSVFFVVVVVVVKCQNFNVLMDPPVWRRSQWSPLQWAVTGFQRGKLSHQRLHFSWACLTISLSVARGCFLSLCLSLWVIEVKRRELSFKPPPAAWELVPACWSWFTPVVNNYSQLPSRSDSVHPAARHRNKCVLFRLSVLPVDDIIQ